MSSLLERVFDRNAGRSQIYTAIALGAIGSIVLPELSSFIAWIRLHFLHISKLSRYQHASKDSEFVDGDPETDTFLHSTRNGKAWALVTGASDGIGYGFVQQLASHNFNVILHGRNSDKIQSQITDLTKQHPTQQFEPFICDATDRAAWGAALTRLATSLSRHSINLTVLINNIGGNPINSKSLTPLAQYEEKHLTSVIDMNVVFPVQITRALLPILVANKPSLIVNMSSSTSIIPVPYLCAYNGGKAFNSQFSKTLRTELLADGHDTNEIEVLSVLAAAVQSGGMKMDTGVFVPSSYAFAGSVLKMVGCGRSEIVGWWSHAIQIWVVSLLPEWARTRLLIKLGTRQKEIREAENKKTE